MKRIVRYVIGIILIGIGINMLLQAEKGLDPWGTFNVAVARALNMSLGVFYICSGIFFVFVNAVIQKKRPDILGMMTSFFMGISIDLFRTPVSALFIYSKWMEFLIGLIIFCLGLSLYLSTNLPRSPVDDLIFSIQKIVKIELQLSKVILDLIVLLTGISLGGQVGIGTVIMALAVGPIANTFINLMEGRNEKSSLFGFRRHTYSNSRKL